MVIFSKHCECPPSRELLAYQNGEIDSKMKAVIRRHLVECEFCNAEASFYERYPQTDEVVAASPMPEPLFELAEALLSKNRETVSIKSLIGEINSVTKKSQ